jgi:hypothetical protein
MFVKNPLYRARVSGCERPGDAQVVTGDFLGKIP